MPYGSYRTGRDAADVRRPSRSRGTIAPSLEMVVRTYSQACASILRDQRKGTTRT